MRKYQADDFSESSKARTIQKTKMKLLKSANYRSSQAHKSSRGALANQETSIITASIKTECQPRIKISHTMNLNRKKRTILMPIVKKMTTVLQSKRM